MRINSNILSLQAQRQLSGIRKSIANSLSRLSSGKRINGAQDDASGLAISTGLTSQIRGLAQIQKSINNMSSTLQVADGAIATQIELVQRMRELALQSANGTLSESDRAYLNSEFTQLLNEIDRISTQTEFNQTKLLDGSLQSANIQTGNLKGQSIQINFSSTRANEIFTRTIGTGTFNETGTYSATNTIYRPQIEDMNGDGYNDLVYVDTADIAIRFNNGSGQFSSKVIIDTTVSSRTYDVGDINNDGKIDVVGPRSNGTLEISYGLGNGAFTPITTMANNLGSNSSRDLDLVDLNEDGWLDIAQTVVDSGELAIYLNKGDGTFWMPTTYSIGVGPRTTDYGDINNDGNIDLVSSSRDTNSLFVYLGSGDGRFSLATTFGTARTNPYDVHLKDINEDDILDIVLSYENGIGTLLGVGNGTYGTETVLSTASTQYILVEDFNYDGHLDIGSRSTSNLLIRYGAGDGTFSSPLTNATTTPNSLFGFAFGDLNNDGVGDIAAGDSTDFRVTVLIAATATSSALDILSIETQSRAEDALDILDTGLANLMTARSRLGAQQKRLEVVADQSLTIVESLSAARSQILDADIAMETAELTRSVILEQAGITVLSQANMNLKNALALLKTLSQ